jgi:hypothetical protein
MKWANVCEVEMRVLTKDEDRDEDDGSICEPFLPFILLRCLSQAASAADTRRSTDSASFLYDIRTRRYEAGDRVGLGTDDDEHSCACGDPETPYEMPQQLP